MVIGVLALVLALSSLASGGLLTTTGCTLMPTAAVALKPLGSLTV